MKEWKGDNDAKMWKGRGGEVQVQKHRRAAGLEMLTGMERQEGRMARLQQAGRGGCNSGIDKVFRQCLF
jgi:hypothetical protein